jgi:hypothetical protein
MQVPTLRGSAKQYLARFAFCIPIAAEHVAFLLVSTFRRAVSFFVFPWDQSANSGLIRRFGGSWQLAADDSNER